MVRTLSPNVLPSLRLALRTPRGSNGLILTLQQRRQFRVSARYHREETPRSFKTQLFESTHQRVKRERADQERFSQQQPSAPGGHYGALIFGMQVGHT